MIIMRVVPTTSFISQQKKAMPTDYGAEWEYKRGIKKRVQTNPQICILDILMNLLIYFSFVSWQSVI